MKILMMAIGSRGDCEPFLGVGQMLRERGEEVICAFPEQYRSLAEESGFLFYSFGPEFIDLLNTKTGKIALGGDKGGLRKVRATLKISKLSYPIQMKMIDLQHEIVQKVEPDCIVFHPKVTYALPWHLKTGKNIAMLSPIPCMFHEVKGHSNVGINKNLGILNPLTYKLVNFATATTIMLTVKKYFKKEFSRSQIQREILKMKIFYTVSPAIFKRPDNWPDNAMVAGFWERDKSSGFEPSKELLAFLEKHPKLLFVTFGSMVNEKTAQNTDLILKALKACEIPAMINIAGGGLCEPDDYDREKFYFVNSIPYDWVLNKMYAVVYHGGAGTTHSAVKAGCATMVIAHAADQPMWDEIVAEAGLGPRGISIGKLNQVRLQEKLLELYHNDDYKKRAEFLAEQMKNENFSEDLYDFITK